MLQKVNVRALLKYILKDSTAAKGMEHNAFALLTCSIDKLCIGRTDACESISVTSDMTTCTVLIVKYTKKKREGSEY